MKLSSVLKMYYHHNGSYCNYITSLYYSLEPWVPLELAEPSVEMIGALARLEQKCY